MSRTSSAVIGLFATIIRLSGTISPASAITPTPVAEVVIVVPPANPLIPSVVAEPAK